ncbi:myrosinase 1-like [Pectinophora gossypiella]|uniref:myrosinase 1-like n=1 Tax=Pectinophora gossypiella TaxID=13191 RepID=UPI00214E01DE|nr:myrosinase 1-like [Pectinophora gossypiella]
MCWKILLLFALVTLRCEGRSSGQLCFPKDFTWGVATASYQIEGAWNTSGKGESIWDRYTHSHPEQVFDHSSGDVADDSYHQFRADISMLRELGVLFYRFSISWPRILPEGFSNDVNEDGLRYYSELINELHANSIQPLVTMYHWDLPQTLQDLGGWTNPIVADYFVDYARVLFTNFGPKVKAWITFNEPLSFCRSGYGGNDAPGGHSSGLEAYMCAHNVLRAHGMTYRMFEAEFKNKTGGNVGITLDMAWLEPATTSEDDQKSAEVARQFMFGWYAHPIYSKTGDYPPIMRRRIDEISRRQHFPRSRLPTFTEEEVKMIRGSSDFLGLNHYTTYLVAKGKGKVAVQPSFDNDMGVIISQKPEWPKSNSTWLRVVPWGFRKILNWVKKTYDNPLVVITENGISSEPGLQDSKRVNYIDAYLRSLHAAVTQDGCNIIGYTHWSLMDNFEWMRGYSERFGLYEVDYTSPQRTRTPRVSAAYYAKIVKTGCIPSQKYSLVFKY